MVRSLRKPDGDYFLFKVRRDTEVKTGVGIKLDVGLKTGTSILVVLLVKKPIGYDGL